MSINDILFTAMLFMAMHPQTTILFLCLLSAIIVVLSFTK
jgi:hypothetical protein